MERQFFVPDLNRLEGETFSHVYNRLVTAVDLSVIPHLEISERTDNRLIVKTQDTVSAIRMLCTLTDSERDDVFIGKAKNHRIELRQYTHGDTVFRYGHKTDVAVGDGFLEEEVHYRVGRPTYVEIVVQGPPDNVVTVLIACERVTVLVVLGTLT